MPHLLPWWLSGKESDCNTGDPGSIPGREDPMEESMATHSSVLGNYTDRGAWRTTVHRVAKSQIQLKQLSSSNMLHPQGMQRVKPISEISLGHILSTGDLRYKFIHLMLIIVNILTYSCPHDLIFESLYGNKPGEQSTRCSEEFLPSRLGKGCPCQ